jgi:allene oxide cyclase
MRRWMIGTAVVGITLAASLASGCGQNTSESSAGQSTRVIHVIEHAETDTTVDVGKKGDSTGDVLTFHNQVFDQRDQDPVGRDLGRCVRIVPGQSYECTWTTILRDGQITVDGPFYDKDNSVLAITGGTGAYDRVRGQMLLSSRKDGSEFNFVFKLAQ